MAAIAQRIEGIGKLARTVCGAPPAVKRPCYRPSLDGEEADMYTRREFGTMTLARWPFRAR
jgi:hypothetical protein